MKMDKSDSTTKVEVAIEHSDDPDTDLELRETISAELSASVVEVENGAATHGLDEVSRRLGLT